MGLFILLEERHRHTVFLSSLETKALRASLAWGHVQRAQGPGDSHLWVDNAAFYLNIHLGPQILGGYTSQSEDQPCLRLGRSSLTKPAAFSKEDHWC